MRIGDGRVRALLSYVATDFEPIQEEEQKPADVSNVHSMSELYISVFFPSCFMYVCMYIGLELEQVEVHAFEANNLILSGGRIAIDGCRAHQGEVRAQTS